MATGARPAHGAMRVSNEDFFGELFPLKTCSLAATGDVWLELMRIVRWNGDRWRGRLTRGQRGIEIPRGAGGRRRP